MHAFIYKLKILFEITCHGSQFIQQEILKIGVTSELIRLAQPGEFTQHFSQWKNGFKQAEAVADVIASQSELSPIVHESNAWWFFKRYADFRTSYSIIPAYKLNRVFFVLLNASKSFLFRRDHIGVCTYQNGEPKHG